MQGAHPRQLFLSALRRVSLMATPAPHGEDRIMTGFLIADARPITDALRNVALFTPTAASARRYAGEAALSVVLVEYAEGPGELTMVATDRYQLAHQTLTIDAGSEPFTFTLPASEATRISSTHGAARHGISVKIEGTELRVESDRGASVHPIDPDGRAAYPAWRRILEMRSEPKEASEVGFTGSLLARLAKIKVNGSAPGEVRMTLTGNSKPAYCQIADGPAILTMTRRLS